MPTGQRALSQRASPCSSHRHDIQAKGSASSAEPMAKQAVAAQLPCTAGINAVTHFFTANITIG